MPQSIEYRIMENGPGWYWEVINGNEVVARGIASSQKDACAQAAEAERKAEPRPRPAPGQGSWLGCPRWEIWAWTQGDHRDNAPGQAGVRPLQLWV
jgi:hypothetical protein